MDKYAYKTCTFGILLAISISIRITLAKGCEPWEWKCFTGECITLKSRCNNQNDCMDHSDERDCPTQHVSTTYSPGCEDGKFHCHNQRQCYYMEWQCDGTQDCDDGSDEWNCPGQSLMPTSSIIGMSVAVGGLFIILIGIIIMITCVRRKNGRRPTVRRRTFNEVVYPDDFPNRPIACPTISGQIIMREPPPRYSSQPDLYYTGPAAAVNFAFSPDETVSRPPPCYSSNPNIVTDMSNMSVCSSVEPPPSYSTQMDENILDTTITEGAINFSFCPDNEDGVSVHQNDDTMKNTMDTSYYSMQSMKSWADNIDAEIFDQGLSLDTNTTDNFRQNGLHLYTKTRSQTASTANLNNRAQMPQHFKHGHHCSTKLSARAQRAKSLGRQYSSTPMLAAGLKRHDNNYHSDFSRRMSLENGQTDMYSMLVNPTYSKLTTDKYEDRRVKSAVQLNGRSENERMPNFDTNSSRSESTSCCNSHQNIMKNSAAGQGLRFWRNNKETMSSSCVSRQSSIPELHESDEGFQDGSVGLVSDNTTGVNTLTANGCKELVFHLPSVKSQHTENVLSPLYMHERKNLGSDTSINSWMC